MFSLLLLSVPLIQEPAPATEAEPVVQGAGPGACRNALEPLEIGVVHRLPALVAGGDEGEVLIQLVQGSLQLFA